MAPNVTRAYKKGTTVVIETSKSNPDSNVTLAGLWKITESTEQNAPIKASLSGLSQVVQFTLSSDAVTTVYVYDHAGNYKQVNLTEYTTLPEASVSYANGEYTITARAQSAGLWKMTDVNGNVLSSTDYNGEANYTNSYPTEEMTYRAKGPISLAKVCVYDAVGSMNELDLDTAEPNVARAYKKGTAAIVEVSDSGAGLWKITESTTQDVAINTLLSGTSQVTQFTLSDSDVSTVYVYDKGGNYAEVSLSPDNNPPTYEGPTYNRGTITLVVEDSEAGLASIGTKTYSDYPQDAKTYTVSTGTASVRLEDALGNYVDVPIDVISPSVNNVYRNEAGTNFKLTMTDRDAGLDKITNADGTEQIENIQSVGKTGTINFRTDSETTAFNVYDEAGNVSEIKQEDMLVDRIGPRVVSITYSKGDCILTVADDESGMWKIVDGTNNAILKDYSISE